MSSVVSEYLHFLRANEQIPRVSYFGRRYTGLIPRFFNIQGALPVSFIDTKLNHLLEKLAEALGRRVTIIVYGTRDIPDSDLGISKALLSTADEGAAELDGITIFVLTAEFQNIDGNEVKTLESLADEFSKSSAKDKLWSFELLIVHCRLTEKCLSSLTNEHLKQFHSNVNEKLDSILRNTISPQNIIVEQNETNIQIRISDILEDFIIESGFCAIKHYLQRFIRKDQTICINYVILMEDVQLAETIQAFFRDQMSFLDMHNVTKDEIPSTDVLIAKLITVVKCAVIPSLEKRFNIPEIICIGILQESKFEENLCKALKTDTVYRLKKIYEQTLAQAEEKGVKQKVPSSNDFVEFVKADWKEEFERTERIFGSMNRVIAVMKKMIFEIDGYLKQSKNYKEVASPENFQQLSDELRKQLLSIKGVYGVGNIYGQLEVHVDEADEFSAVKKSVDDLLHKFHFQQPYSVKHVEVNIKN